MALFVIEQIDNAELVATGGFFYKGNGLILIFVTMLFTAGALIGGWWYIFKYRSVEASSTTRCSTTVTVDTDLDDETAPRQTMETAATNTGDFTSVETGDGSRIPYGPANPCPLARELLEHATVDELRGLLRLRGLRVSGLKADLIERLLHCSVRSVPCEECCGAVLYASRRSARRVPPQALNSQEEADQWIARVLGARE